MIEAGRVRVNGEVRRRMPVMVEVGKDVITVDEAEVSAEGAGADVAAGEVPVGALKEEERVYFLLNKPKGILVTSEDPEGRKTVYELMKGVKERVFPVGRLDMDSRGALLMTNDGELANRLTHPRYGVEKTYLVEVDGRVGHGEIEKIKRGTWLGPERAGGRGAGERARSKQGERTERFGVKVVGRERGRTILEVKIAEGKNREIRRVMARVGHTVRDLNRVAIGERITLRGLGVGEYRALSAKEVEWLYKASSPERKAEERAATQAWYERKEMEKERKRLSAEMKDERRKTRDESVGEKAKPFRPQPVRKGRKPFVPPSGRNAGKVLGGSFLGRKRMERESGVPAHEDAGAIQREIRAEHPLGDAAGSDE